jgi:hypothetical protein
MSEPHSIIDAQLQHLLNVVEKHRSNQCSKLHNAAKESASRLITNAHSDARKRLHDEIHKARDYAHQKLTSTRALLQTRKRMARQQLDEALLEGAWKQLKTSLQARWDDEASRQQWTASLLETAHATLVSGQWIIQHPAGLTDAEAAALQLQVYERLGHTPELEACEEISAGLRICTDGACIDGTSDGLMHDRQHIESSILAAVHSMDNTADG